ncbi:MAG: branched-chain amino acid ABC transporter substrate-binding protein [Acetobacteraceae bacterium]|nr:branched-chain amino acid ABC transporter substrate-binding protein [Acetobacteraceae bacterium]
MVRSISPIARAVTVFAVLAAAPAAHAADIKLGLVLPMTGANAGEGKDMQNAIELAVAAINAQGGVIGDKITTITADDACDPQQGAIAASKLVSSSVTAVIGGYCSGGVLPTLKIYGDANIPFIIVAANSTKLVDANPGNTFLINSTGDAQAETAIKLFRSKGFKTIAIVDEGDAYSSDLSKLTAADFTKDGGKVVATETTAAGEQDYSSLVSRIKEAKPDAVFWTAYYNGGSLLTKQLRQAGYRGAIVLGDGNNSPDFLKIAGSAAQGAYLLSPPSVDFLPTTEAFRKDYVKANNQQPGAYAALSYDGTMLLADAIKRAKSTDPKAIITALKASSYEGLAGKVTFTPKNTLVGSNFVVLVDKDGKWTRAE